MAKRSSCENAKNVDFVEKAKKWKKGRNRGKEHDDDDVGNLMLC